LSAKIIRKPEVRRRTGYSNTTIWREEKAGRFPRRVQLNPEAGPRGGVGYYEDEVDEWIRRRVRGISGPLPIGRHAGAEAQ
jgi:prophage regulatory protein